MHVLDESHILLFLLQLLVLLGAARTLGALCEELRVPAIAGEILAGVLLGPTVFGRIGPDAQRWLFPSETVQATMLETVSWLGVFFLLLAEIIPPTSLVVPLLGKFVLFTMILDTFRLDHVDDGDQILFLNQA